MPIDIGSSAIDRPTFELAFTIVDKNNPANASGKITSIEIWANTDLSNCEVATFFVVSGNYLSTRDIHTIGSVTAGAKRTFSGLNITVEAGDHIGIYYSAGQIEKTAAGLGIWGKTGDNIPCTNVEFTFFNDNAISLYGLGFVIIPKSISGAFGFSGTVNKLSKKILSGTFAFTGNLLRNISKSITGVFNLSGILSSAKGYTKALSGVLTFTTSLTVIIYYTWSKFTKVVDDWTKVSKSKDDCTKVDKTKGDFSKVEKE